MQFIMWFKVWIIFYVSLACVIYVFRYAFKINSKALLIRSLVPSPWVIVVILILSSTLEIVQFKGNSMLPTSSDSSWGIQIKYGFRLPGGSPLWGWFEPRRGDVVGMLTSFNPYVGFGKRIIGLPGDDISYIDKVLYINGKKVSTKRIKIYNKEKDSWVYEEQLPGKTHQILVYANTLPQNFYHLKVPENYYFMMGDNRDKSTDSREFGFVKKSDIVSKQLFV